MASARDCFSPVPTSPFLLCEFCQTQNSFTSGSAQPSACNSGSTFFKCWAFCLSPTTPEWEEQCKTDLFFSPVSIKLCSVIFAWHFHTTGIKHTLLKPACNTWLCSSFSYGKFQLQWQSLTALSSPPTLLSPPGKVVCSWNMGEEQSWSFWVQPLFLLMTVLQVWRHQLFLQGHHLLRVWQLEVPVHMDQLAFLFIIHLRLNFFSLLCQFKGWLRALNSIVLQI